MPVNSDRRRPGLAGGVVRGGEDDHDGFGITEGIGEDVNDEIVITEWISEGVRDEFVKTGLSGEDVMDEFVITEGTGEDFIVEIQIIGEDAGPWARGDLPGAKTITWRRKERSVPSADHRKMHMRLRIWLYRR